MKNSDLELYTDYLLSTFGATTATGLLAMVDGDVSHDRITRFLSKQAYTSKDLWLQVKAMVRQVEDTEGVLIFDDTIQEKEWTSQGCRAMLHLPMRTTTRACYELPAVANILVAAGNISTTNTRKCKPPNTWGNRS